jgi:hypothetical protein
VPASSRKFSSNYRIESSGSARDSMEKLTGRK